MINTPMPINQTSNTYYPQSAQPQPVQNNTATNDLQKTMLREQSMAISFDIAAEYSAIGRMNGILAGIAKEIQTEEDPERKKLLEARLSSINNMILQRELKINQMEQVKNQIDKQAI